MFEEHLPELTISVDTGMRKGEQYGAVWKQVDFKRSEVHIPKTKNGDARSIPMSTAVHAAFLALKPTGSKPADRVFPIKDSRAWFEAARDRAGVENYHWHDNRHTFCSRLAMANVPLKTIQTLAGHKTIAITARYAHLAPNALHAAVELIDVPTDPRTDTSKVERISKVAKKPRK